VKYIIYGNVHLLVLIRFVNHYVNSIANIFPSILYIPT